MICHGYVAVDCKRVLPHIFDHITAEYMQVCDDFLGQSGNMDLLSCEICGDKDDVVIHLCPIIEHHEGLFAQKTGMILFYVISVCEMHVGNNWLVFKHRGLNAFNGYDKSVVLERLRQYTNSCILHDRVTIKEVNYSLIEEPFGRA